MEHFKPEGKIIDAVSRFSVRSFIIDFCCYKRCCCPLQWWLQKELEVFRKKKDGRIFSEEELVTDKRKTESWRVIAVFVGSVIHQITLLQRHWQRYVWQWESAGVVTTLEREGTVYHSWFFFSFLFFWRDDSTLKKTFKVKENNEQ